MPRVVPLVLLMALPAAADAPNLFEPREMSSVSILTMVLTCARSARAADTTLSEAEALALCSCTTDAHRANRKKRRGPRVPTPAQQQRCANVVADARTNRQSPTPAPPPASSGAAPKTVRAVDTTTGAVADIPEDVAAQLKSSTRYAPLVNGRVQVTDQLGRRGDIAVEDTAHALQLGYHLLTGAEMEAERTAK